MTSKCYSQIISLLNNIKLAYKLKSFEGKKNKAPKGLNFAEILVVVLNPALISAAVVVVAAVGTLSSLIASAVVIKTSVFRNSALISSAFIVHSSGIIHSAHVSAAFVVISFSGDGICAENKKGKQ